MEGAPIVTFSHYKLQRIVSLLYEIEDVMILLSNLLLFIEEFSGLEELGLVHAKKDHRYPPCLCESERE